jgi:hypothetical protein
MFKNYLLLIFNVSGLFLLQFYFLVAQDNVEIKQVRLPDNVRIALETNANELNPISLVWQRKRNTKMDFEILMRQIKCLYNYGFIEPYNGVFMWQNSKSYLYYTTKSTLEGDYQTLPYTFEVQKKKIKLIETVSERAFDGTTVYNGNGSASTRSNTPGMDIYTKEQSLKTFGLSPVCHSEYLLYSGYKFPIKAEELGMIQQSLILFLAHSGRFVEFKKISNNVNSIVIESEDILWSKRKQIFEFFLDTNLTFAIKKWTIKTTDNKLLCSIENEQFEQISGKKIYLPRKCVVSHYSYATVPELISELPLFTDEYLLVEVSTKRIVDKQFDLRTKYSLPGTRIGDRTLKDTDAGVQYIIPANPADLDRVIEAALTGKDFVPTPLPSTTAIVIKWLLCIAGIAMIFYAGYKKFVKK